MFARLLCVSAVSRLCNVLVVAAVRRISFASSSEVGCVCVYMCSAWKLDILVCCAICVALQIQ
jgi:hypothetical protein